MLASLVMVICDGVPWPSHCASLIRSRSIASEIARRNSTFSNNGRFASSLMFRLNA